MELDPNLGSSRIFASRLRRVSGVLKEHHEASQTRRISKCATAVLIAFALAGCEVAKKPDAAPAPAPADLDIKPIVRDFLRTMPADCDELPARDLAHSRSFIVDVRQPDEYVKGTLPGAVNVPLRSLALDVQVLPSTDSDIVLVCDSGHRSAIGMAVLQMLGYKKARSLQGGLRAWPESLSEAKAAAPQRSDRSPNINPQLQAMLDYYLVHTLPVDWGAISSAGLTEDQQRKSSTELDPMAETFDQGRSVLVGVDEREEFARAHLYKAIHLPLRHLPKDLDTIPLETMVHWA